MRHYMRREDAVRLGYKPTVEWRKESDPQWYERYKDCWQDIWKNSVDGYPVVINEHAEPV
jgi:hypothetical protein